MSLYRCAVVMLLWGAGWWGGADLQLAGADDAELLVMQARQRDPIQGKPAQWTVSEQQLRWDPRQTAIVVCDMWDRHWCQGATARVAEMAPRMNALLSEARRRGVLIIHAPSSTMDYYAGTPARLRAQRASDAGPVAAAASDWCLRLDAEPRLPIDDADGGCDCTPQCQQASPWRRQIETLEILPADAVSDSGVEIQNLLAEQNIQNVLLLGVHTNMCVLGRPFGLRQMVRAGKNVALVRDLTDSMYNSRQAPYVDHRRGTELVVQHIEQYVCPTVLADDVLGEPAAPHVVFIIGEDEYDTATTLPEFAESELAPRGIRSTFVMAAEDAPHDFAGIEAVNEADLVVVSVRRRTPQKEQLALLRTYVESGKPLVGIRTASHAFDADPPAGHEHWSDFDQVILGGDYQNHYGNKPPRGPRTLVKPHAEASGHPVLEGIPARELAVESHLYRNRDLGPRTELLLTGIVDGEETVEPVAWTNDYRGGRVFYTSLGSPSDFEVPEFRRLLLNGIYWSLELPAPQELPVPQGEQ